MLERLFAQEKVVSLLYAKTFPINLRTEGIQLNHADDKSREASTEERSLAAILNHATIAGNSPATT
jgi:hypothetical protein